MTSPAELITAPEPFLSTYDGPILTGLARGGLLDSLVWPSWWCTGLQGREELRMWASLSGSGDSKKEVLGQGSKASALRASSGARARELGSISPPGIMLFPHSIPYVHQTHWDKAIQSISS